MRDEIRAGFPDGAMYGGFGGSYIPENLEPVMDEIAREYEKCRADASFKEEYLRLLKEYVGRPSALTECLNLSKEACGVRIFLKREDLNHTGAHKINNCIGQALLARRMGKKKLIAETGAGMHGVATATVAALMGMECDIYMGAVDIGRQAPNVLRMRALGANVVSVEEGQRTLKEAVDAALAALCADTSLFYLIGSAVGPHPYPTMVQDFQRIIGDEARAQILEREGRLPNAVVACVGAEATRSAPSRPSSRTRRSASLEWNRRGAASHTAIMRRRLRWERPASCTDSEAICSPTGREIPRKSIRSRRGWITLRSARRTQTSKPAGAGNISVPGTKRRWTPSNCSAARRV